jgi:hypothetical protein
MPLHVPARPVFDPDLEQGGVAADDADRGMLVARLKLRHPCPDWRFDVMTRGASPVR